MIFPGLTNGRVVHYTDPERDGRHITALITEVDESFDPLHRGLVYLTLFPRQESPVALPTPVAFDGLYTPGVTSPEPRTWHWIERS